VVAVDSIGRNVTFSNVINGTWTMRLQQLGACGYCNTINISVSVPGTITMPNKLPLSGTVTDTVGIYAYDCLEPDQRPWNGDLRQSASGVDDRSLQSVRNLRSADKRQRFRRQRDRTGYGHSLSCANSGIIDGLGR
jgi:hypothetical protein